MSQTPNTAIAVIGIDIGKNSFHVVGQDERGAIVFTSGQIYEIMGACPPSPANALTIGPSLGTSTMPASASA